MAAFTYWKVRASAALVLLFGALVVGVLVAIAFAGR
jgi:hypothetical protein